MAHLGPRAFEEIAGEVVQTTSFVANKKLEMCDAQDATEDQLLEMARREGINLNKYRK